VNVKPQREQVAQEPDEERHAEVRQVEAQDGVGQGEEQRFRHQLLHQPPAARPERAGRVEPVPGDVFRGTLILDEGDFRVDWESPMTIQDAATELQCLVRR
jgi:hypothetical protein